MTAIGTFLKTFGSELVDTTDTVSPTAKQVSDGLLLNAGRNGTQTINLPTSNIVGSPSVFIIASDSNVSTLNTVTITGAGSNVILDYVDSFAAFQWLSAKGRWVRL